jgi:hypothetical protein
VNRPFEVHRPQDRIAQRRVLFAVELLDPVTLDRVSYGMKEVKAHGLQGKPIVNASRLFVWLDEDIEQLQKISIDPGVLPYEETERTRDQLNLKHDSAQRIRPLISIELSPRVDYPFDTGITGLRGTLVEDRTRLEPVPKAEVYLRWLDQDGNWHPAPTRSHTTPARSDPPAKGGDFVAILRFAPFDDPQLDASGNLTVRLRVERGEDKRGSTDLKVPQGRVVSPSTPNQFVFAWDELEP